MTLRSCQIAVIPHQKLFDIIEKHSRIGLALWTDTLMDAALYRQWSMNVGRSSAHERVAHLLCELFIRMQRVGVTNVNSCRTTADADRHWGSDRAFDRSR